MPRTWTAATLRLSNTLGAGSIGWAPALIIAIPLIGVSLQHDERRHIYRAAHHYSANPAQAGPSDLADIDAFLSDGNFRPIGRYLEALAHSASFEAGEATRLAPHAVQGFVRLFMVFLLAYVTARVVGALARPAGDWPSRTALALYPLSLGTTLVAVAPSSPLTANSFMLLMTVTLVLAVSLSVARDQDMRARPLRWYEAGGMALLGAATAGVYDLAYVAPPLAAAFIAARAIASSLPVRNVLRLAALRRWIALSAGFLAVFVPVRVTIAGRCEQSACYDGSNLSLSSDALELAVGRFLTGAPPLGWSRNERLAVESGTAYGMLDLAANALLALLLLAIIAATVAAATAAASRPEVATDPDTGGGDEYGDGPNGSRRHLRLAAALALYGTAAAVLSGLLVSLSEHVQRVRPPPGNAWRETLLVQVGWSFVIVAVAVAAIGSIRARAAAKMATVLVAVLLGAALTQTLLANARLALIDRYEPLHAVVSLISESTVNIDPTGSGNDHRCALIEAYEARAARAWSADIRTELDNLMTGRHGLPYCDRSPSSAGAP